MSGRHGGMNDAPLTNKVRLAPFTRFARNRLPTSERVVVEDTMNAEAQTWNAEETFSHWPHRSDLDPCVLLVFDGILHV